MKRFIVGLTSAVLMLLSAVPMTANAEDICGDANADGTVNAIDAAKIMYFSYEAGVGTISDEINRAFELCEIYRDGGMNAKDAIYLNYAICYDAVTDGKDCNYVLPDGSTSFGCISKPNYASVNDSAISILYPDFTVEELAAWDYQVPIVVTLDPSIGINFCEFGLESELPITSSSIYEDEKLYGIAKNRLKQKKWRSMNRLQSKSKDNFAWFSYADYETFNNGCYALLAVEVPKYYDGGEKFNIRIVSDTKTRRAFAGQMTEDGKIGNCFLLKGGNGGNIDLVMPAEGSHPFYGDIDANGVLNIIDVMMLQKYLLGLPDMPVDPELSDLNEDGCIDVFDLGLLKRKLLAAK